MASVAILKDTTIVGEYEEQLVTMIVDKQLFGIPILQVQDIVEASKITPVPLAPSAIAGVLNLRGRIVTVIDLRKLMGNFEEVPWESQMGVTVEYKGDLYTLLVDAIGDVRTLPKRDFDKAPSTLEENVRLLCSGIFRLRGNLLVVLDVSRILLPAAIEASPELSVEDRRARKQAAIAANDEIKTEQGRRQLSALMTDLNAYESDFDSGLDSLSGDADDIKARKRANRDRRPVGERWREVREEKARRDGSTVYRMREPEEEVLEEARDKAEEENATWESEWKARQDGDYVSRLPEPEDDDSGDAGDFGYDDQPVPADEPAVADFVPSDEPVSDIPPSFDEPVMDEIAPADEPVMDEIAPADEPVVDELTPDSFEPISDDSAPVDEVTGFDAPGFDVPETPESMPADTDSPAGTGGVVSDWWNRMRGKPESDDDAVEAAAGETPDELPMTDDSAGEVPAFDEPAAKGKSAGTGESKSKSKAKMKESSAEETPVELPAADDAGDLADEDDPVELPMADDTVDFAAEDGPVELPMTDDPAGDIPASDEPATEGKSAGKGKAKKKKKTAKASSSKPKGKSSGKSKKK